MSGSIGIVSGVFRPTERPPLHLHPTTGVFTRADGDETWRPSGVGLPEGPASAEQLLTRLLAEISRYARERQGVVLDSELLYRIAERRIAEGNPPRRQALQGLIGAAFRLSSAEMVFTADVAHGGGHVVEAGARLGRTTSLTVPFKRSARWPFERYLDELLLPFWSGREPGITREALVAAGDLNSIRAFLSEAPHVGMMTNACWPSIRWSTTSC